MSSTTSSLLSISISNVHVHISLIILHLWSRVTEILISRFDHLRNKLLLREPTVTSHAESFKLLVDT